MVPISSSASCRTVFCFFPTMLCEIYTCRSDLATDPGPKIGAGSFFGYQPGNYNTPANCIDSHAKTPRRKEICTSLSAFAPLREVILVQPHRGHYVGDTLLPSPAVLSGNANPLCALKTWEYPAHCRCRSLHWYLCILRLRIPPQLFSGG